MKMEMPKTTMLRFLLLQMLFLCFASTAHAAQRGELPLLPASCSIISPFLASVHVQLKFINGLMQLGFHSVLLSIVSSRKIACVCVSVCSTAGCNWRLNLSDEDEGSFEFGWNYSIRLTMENSSI